MRKHAGRIGFAHDLDWSLSYVSHEEAFPVAWTGSEDIPHEAWRAWEEPFRVSYRDYVAVQREKESGVAGVRDALKRARVHEKLDPSCAAVSHLHMGATCMIEQMAVMMLARSERHLIDRHMEFMSCEECYLSDGVFDLDRVAREWGARLNAALSAGYEGIRVTGSTGWLQTREWPNFWKYEANLNESIADQRMTVLCTYPLVGSAGCDILDVTHTHQSAITKRGGRWEVIETAGLKHAKEEIRKLNDELEQRVIERTRDLQVARTELARAERLTTMGLLAASITHEIAQPIGAMVFSGEACLNWLENERPNLEAARAAARQTVENGSRAADVFQSIRSLVQKAEPRVARLDVETVIKDALVIARGELHQNQVAVQIEVDAGLPPVLGDRMQLQQVLLNLIINAVQSMSDVHDRPRNLIIRCQKDAPNDSVLILVEDSGIGFDAGSRERIFDSMFTTKEGGMGMGLSISRSIITAHRGRISASPGESIGATFRIVLPSERSPLRETGKRPRLPAQILLKVEVDAGPCKCGSVQTAPASQCRLKPRWTSVATKSSPWALLEARQGSG